MTDRSGSQIDHLNVAVPDLATAVAFYRPTLDSIGIVTILEIPADYTPGIPAMHGFGWPETKPFFWLVDQGTVGTNMHLAFTVDTRDAVRASTRLPWRQAPRIAMPRRCTGSITPTTTAASSPTRMASISKRSATTPSNTVRRLRRVRDVCRS